MRLNEGKNHFPAIDSNTLAIVGRSDIGLRSLQMDVGECNLGTGTTSADFQIGGR